MTEYIIKSSISLVLLFGLYSFFLEKEKLFVFNRFFLLSGIVFSLLIPFVSVPVHLYSSGVPAGFIPAVSNVLPYNGTTVNYNYSSLTQPSLPSGGQSITLIQILMFVWLLGVFFFLFRFSKNIFFLFSQKKASEKITWSGRDLALVSSQINPFCFLRTIFINKHDYESERISKELLNHELEHIKQLHSVDVILVELIRSLYWFNPVLILYNKAIRVNHEYLADNAVIMESADIKSYAGKLLDFISCDIKIPLTSGFNPSLTKKRLTMLAKAQPEGAGHRFRMIVTISLALVFFLLISFKNSETPPAAPVSPEKTIPAAPAAFAVQKAVKGFIVNQFGEYLKGVTIKVKNKNTAVLSDATGRFIIADLTEADSLVFSYEGSKTHTLAPVFSSDMIVILTKDLAIRVPVQTKSDTLPVYGKIGKNPDLPAEDKAALLAERKQLVIVDSVEYTDPVNNIPASDIESLSVNMNNSVTAKYGDKGTNGVVIITTKKSYNASHPGVSRELLDEYEQILSKYRKTLPDGRVVMYMNLSKPDKDRLESIFFMMSQDQRTKLEYIFIPSSTMIIPKSVPSAEQLELFKDSKVYGVWIDEKRVSNVSLNKYRNTDFSRVYVSKLLSNAADYGKYISQVDLTTNAKYQEQYNKWISDTGHTLVPLRMKK